jgi:hypothetical protein
LVIGAVVLWIVPIFVAVGQGKAKDRAGLAYGLFLGWLGATRDGPVTSSRQFSS